MDDGSKPRGVLRDLKKIIREAEEARERPASGDGAEFARKAEGARTAAGARRPAIRIAVIASVALIAAVCIAAFFLLRSAPKAPETAPLRALAEKPEIGKAGAPTAPRPGVLRPPGPARATGPEPEDAGARGEPYVPPPGTRVLTNEEEDFIVAEFGRWVRKTDADYEPQEVPIAQRKVNVRRWKTADPSDDIMTSWGPTIEIWGDGDEGYVPGRSFARYHRTELEQDFDKDGTTELVFAVNETYGGTAAWNVFYSLERPARGRHRLHRLEIPCSCPRKAWCPDSPMNELKGVSGHLIAIEQCCWNYLLFQTGECCDEVLFGYKKGKLSRKSLETHNCAELARSLASAKTGATESP